MPLYNNKALLCTGLTFHRGRDRSGGEDPAGSLKHYYQAKNMMKVLKHIYMW